MSKHWKSLLRLGRIGIPNSIMSTISIATTTWLQLSTLASTTMANWPKLWYVMVSSFLSDRYTTHSRKTKTLYVDFSCIHLKTCGWENQQLNFTNSFLSSKTTRLDKTFWIFWKTHFPCRHCAESLSGMLTYQPIVVWGTWSNIYGSRSFDFRFSKKSCCMND